MKCKAVIKKLNECVDKIQNEDNMISGDVNAKVGYKRKLIAGQQKVEGHNENRVFNGYVF